MYLRKKERLALQMCEEACREFIRKCDSFQARSRRSQKEMRVALELLDEARAK